MRAGTLTVEAWVLFAILFLWQFPHFYAIAWMYREDYSRAGIKMLPVIEPDGDSTVRQILATSMLLIPISMLPSWLGMIGLSLPGRRAAARVGLRLRRNAGDRERTRARARSVLLASVVYLPSLYGLMMADRTRCGTLSFLRNPARRCPALTGCRSGPSLPSYGLVPDFELTDQTGQPFRSQDSCDGRVWVANLIFTSCMGPCPRMSAQMRQIRDATRARQTRACHALPSTRRATRRRFSPVTPRRFSAGPSWYFLTGPMKVHSITSAYDVFHLGHVDGNLEHSTRFVLVDRQARIRGYYDSSDAESIQTLIADLNALDRAELDADRLSGRKRDAERTRRAPADHRIRAHP